MTRINWRKQGLSPGPPCRPGTTRTRSSASASADARRCHRPARDPRPRRGRLRLRRVQAAVRHLVGDRLGPAARVPGRGAGQPPGRAVQRGSQEGQRVHPAGQPDRHARLALQNTTGYMVGASYEQGGIIKDGAKMINAVTNSAVPHLTINMASSFGGQSAACPAALRSPLHVRPGRPPSRRDGRGPARRGAVHRRAAGVGRGHRAAVRRGGGPGPHRRDRGPDRGRVTSSSSPPASTTTIIDPRDTLVPSWAWPCRPCTMAPSPARRGFGVFRM